MNKRLGFNISSSQTISIILMFSVFLTGCGASPHTTSTTTSEYLETDIRNYPAIANNSTTKNYTDSYLGLVKIFTEHGFRDNKGKVGSLNARGTGCLVVYHNRWFVLTARHIIVPNPKTRSIIIKEQRIDFDRIIETGSRIAISNIGIEPLSLWLPTDENVDVAVIEIPKEMQRSIVYRDLGKLDKYNTNKNDFTISLGSDVEVWGYPAKQSPQMKQIEISDIIKEGYFVLNQAVEPGYSGGLILLPMKNTQKTIIGMVIRSDVEAEQSIAIAWPVVLSILSSAANQTEFTKKMELNEAQKYIGASFTLYEFHKFPFKVIVSHKWWEFWKK